MVETILLSVVEMWEIFTGCLWNFHRAWHRGEQHGFDQNHKSSKLLRIQRVPCRLLTCLRLLLCSRQTQMSKALCFLV